ncbi:MAG: hypothetical protein NC833_03075 [Candidatus Omnitrophica bacterium]|nr:hypothetical protein [Candidatus Omnitrophota bacterium]
MRAKLIKIIPQKDKRGKVIYLLCLKGDDGKSYRLWTGKQFGNYIRWFKVIDIFRSGKEIILDNLVLKGKSLIDADSLFNFKVIDNLLKVTNE